MMRFSVASSVALSVALFAGAPVWGQFQEPTKEELQMTADSKVPGANAVYLNLADDQDGPANTGTFYERVKILTERGKEKATLRFTHDPNTKFEVEGRTVHKDGTIIAFTDKPSDLVEYKTKNDQLNTLVFTLPSAEVGSILEYRVKFRYDGMPPFPNWFIQQDMFVHHAHYSFKPGMLGSVGITYLARIGDNSKVAFKNGVYTLDLNDVATLPDEDWMPPLNAFKWRVSFFGTTFKTTQEYWDAAGRVWTGFVRDFTNPTGTLKKAAEDIVAPGDSDTVKAQKIYAAVMKLDNTDFTREKTRRERKKEKIKDIHNAQDVWRDQSGDGDEIALLYVALCRAAGLNVVPMSVVNRSRALFDEGLLNYAQMDDFIAVGQLDGKEVFLDPGQKMCPFGSLHWKHTLATGFRLTDKTAVLVNTPSLSYKASNITRIADLAVDSSGGMLGTVRLIMRGQESLYWRQIAQENDEDEVKKRFNEWMNGYLPEGVQGEFDHFLGLTDYESNLMANVRVSGNLGTVTGKHLFVPGLFFQAKSKHPFVSQDKRTIPVDVHFARSEQDDVTYRLPEGYSMDVNGKPDTILWPNHAKLVITTSADPGAVHVVRDLVYNYTIFDPKEYGSLHDFYQKVATADQQQITLTKSSANTVGN
jgi:Domain of Unknown Function with PDB structure (DUF3857)/Transglutaminase-like superfamily